MKYIAIRFNDKTNNYKGEAILSVGSSTVKCTAEGITPDVCHSNLMAQVDEISEDMSLKIHVHPKLSEHPKWRNYVTSCCEAGFGHETNFIISLCPKCGRHVDSYMDMGTDQNLPNLPF